MHRRLGTNRAMESKEAMPWPFRSPPSGKGTAVKVPPGKSRPVRSGLQDSEQGGSRAVSAFRLLQASQTGEFNYGSCLRGEGRGPAPASYPRKNPADKLGS